MYYPELKEFKTNFLNQISIQNEHNYNMKIPWKTFKQIHKVFLQGARKKCRLVNILYEISRIQLILQEKFGDQLLLKSHQMGAIITENKLDQINSKKSNHLQIKPFDPFEMENQSESLEELELLIQQR
ncbi:unnamed protein product [Paramecium sonneborni]|nr:unnamed protein product [Paramecium sonneborni]